MDLYIVRHAIAEERSPDGDDSERSLTAKGRERFEQHVRALERLEVRAAAVLHSPWRRARQTAELLARLSDAPPIAIDALAGPPREPLLEAIGQAGRAVMAVGHEPWLTELLAWLVLGHAEDGDARFRLKKGGVAHLVGEPRPGAMQLRALYSSRVLRLAAGKH